MTSNSIRGEQDGSAERHNRGDNRGRSAGSPAEIVPNGEGVGIAATVCDQARTGGETTAALYVHDPMETDPAAEEVVDACATAHIGIPVDGGSAGSEAREARERDGMKRAASASSFISVELTEDDEDDRVYEFHSERLSDDARGYPSGTEDKLLASQFDRELGLVGEREMGEVFSEFTPSEKRLAKSLPNVREIDCVPERTPEGNSGTLGIEPSPLYPLRAEAEDHPTGSAADKSDKSYLPPSYFHQFYEAKQRIWSSLGRLSSSSAGLDSVATSAGGGYSSGAEGADPSSVATSSAQTQVTSNQTVRLLRALLPQESAGKDFPSDEGGSESGKVKGGGASGEDFGWAIPSDEGGSESGADYDDKKAKSGGSDLHITAMIAGVRHKFPPEETSLDDGRMEKDPADFVEEGSARAPLANFAQNGGEAPTADAAEEHVARKAGELAVLADVNTKTRESGAVSSRSRHRSRGPRRRRSGKCAVAAAGLCFVSALIIFVVLFAVRPNRQAAAAAAGEASSANDGGGAGATSTTSTPGPSLRPTAADEPQAWLPSEVTTTSPPPSETAAPREKDDTNPDIPINGAETTAPPPTTSQPHTWSQAPFEATTTASPPPSETAKPREWDRNGPKDRDGPADGAKTTAPPPTMTEEPTLQAPEQGTDDGWDLEALLRELVGDEIDVRRTPQHRAYRWMVNKDGYTKQSLSAGTMDEERATQRFLLALLRFATSEGGPWKRCGGGGGAGGRRNDGGAAGAGAGCGVGADGTAPAEWLSDTDECGWFGVECSEGGAVVGIDLAKNNLSGPLPGELFKLPSLRELRLEDNALSGSIPPELTVALLKEGGSLRTVRLHFNAFQKGVGPRAGCRSPCQGLGGENVTRSAGYSFSADCGPANLTGPPGVKCPCCTDCCDAETRTCMSVHCEEKK